MNYIASVMRSLLPQRTELLLDSEDEDLSKLFKSMVITARNGEPGLSVEEPIQEPVEAGGRFVHAVRASWDGRTFRFFTRTRRPLQV